MATKKMKVTVDLNKQRERLWNNYNKLVELLNQHINNSEEVVIFADDLRPYLNNIRDNIASIGCSYIEGSEVFADISDTLPELAVFNSEE